MATAQEICERNELIALIKRISAFYGGDDMVWLKEYAREMVLNRSRHEALECFRDLANLCVKSLIAFVPQTAIIQYISKS